MDILIWINQGILAAFYAFSGILKMALPAGKLDKMGLTKHLSLSRLRLIGIYEFLGAIGLILPWAIHILPILTPIVAQKLLLFQNFWF